MRLLITDPLRVVADLPDVVSVRAEDMSGGFGIWPGHADFLTVLAISVLAWHQADGRQGFCAVRRGILTVTGGQDVAVATRQAVLGADLTTLEQDVLARFHAELDAERTERIAAMRLHMQAVRQIVRYLQPRQRGAEVAG